MKRLFIQLKKRIRERERDRIKNEIYNFTDSTVMAPMSHDLVKPSIENAILPLRPSVLCMSQKSVRRGDIHCLTGQLRLRRS